MIDHLMIMANDVIDVYDVMDVYDIVSSGQH